MANEKKKTSIGGQALIEGIMMRGPFLTSMATRLPDGADLWDSRKVKDDRSILIPYGGRPLRSCESCWWQVRVWAVMLMPATPAS